MDLITLVESHARNIKGKNIKTLKPNPKTHFKDGYFPKDKCIKYVSHNNEPCIYRSSLEFKTFLWCENSPQVKYWSSEPFSIPYYLKNTKGVIKKRNYNIDLIIEFIDGRLWFVEIKPYSLCKRGSLGFEMNAAKWNASILWCKEQDFKIEFKIITEKFNFLV